MINIILKKGSLKITFIFLKIKMNKNKYNKPSNIPIKWYGFWISHGNGAKRKYKTLNESHARWTEAYKNLEVDWEDCLKKNKDAIKKNKQLIKSHNEITRAYNGLHQLGKFAEQEGIDIRKHQKQLPEYEFHQKHTLLESGRVEHKYLLKKPKKETEDKK